MKPGVSIESARAAKQRAADVFRQLVGEEVSVGLSRLADDGFCLKINLTNEPAEATELPDEVEGVPVLVEVVGKIRKL